MTARVLFRRAIPALLLLGAGAVKGAEDSPKSIKPQPVELTRTAAGEGWFAWGPIASLKGFASYRERITALSSGIGEAIWVGTSHGRLLSFESGRWSMQAQFDRIQLTGIAVESATRIWVSTSDGIRLLDSVDGQWKPTEFRDYFEGHPSFVSGGYIPGEDAARLWGYVDRIYMPPKNRAYAPLVVSTEHGLFSWGGYGRVWHHFLPHYWGANSRWLDTRELIPHRRPTCIVEDHEGNLWVGTDGDGMVRFEARGRAYHLRDPQHNRQDGTEFTRVSQAQVGWPFERVADLSRGVEHGVWCVLKSKEGQSAVARWLGGRWQVLPWPKEFAPAGAVEEIEPGAVLVGIGEEPSESRGGLVKLDWASRALTKIEGPDHKIREITATPDGRVFAASWWTLYEKRSGRVQ
jgi:hypothetical protein